MSTKTQAHLTGIAEFFATVISEPKCDPSSFTFPFRPEDRLGFTKVIHSLRCPYLMEIRHSPLNRGKPLMFLSETASFEEMYGYVEAGQICEVCSDMFSVSKRSGIQSVKSYVAFLEKLKEIIDAPSFSLSFADMLRAKKFIKTSEPVLSTSYNLHGLGILSQEASLVLEDAKVFLKEALESSEGQYLLKEEAAILALDNLNPVKNDSELHQNVKTLMRPHIEAQASVLAASGLYVIIRATDACFEGPNAHYMELLVEPWTKARGVWALPLAVFEAVKNELRLSCWVEPAHVDHAPTKDDLLTTASFLADAGDDKVTVFEAYMAALLV